MSAPTVDRSIGSVESAVAHKVERLELPSAAAVIDQLVVDRFLTAATGPVSFNALAAPILGPEWRVHPGLRGLLDSLAADPRYLGVSKSKKGMHFKPELTPATEVESPSWQAIISGRAVDASLEQTAAALRGIELFTEVIYGRHNNRPRPIEGVLPVRELWGMLGGLSDILTELGAPPNPRNFAAFMTYVNSKDNGRFHRLPDERVVLTGVFTGNVESIVPLWPIYHMRTAVSRAVDVLRAERRAGRPGRPEVGFTVSPSLMFRVIEERFNSFLTPMQRAELEACILSLPGVTVDGRSTFRIKPVTAAVPGQRVGS